MSPEECNSWNGGNSIQLMAGGAGGRRTGAHRLVDRLQPSGAGAKSPKAGRQRGSATAATWFFAKRSACLYTGVLSAIPAWHEQHRWRAACPAPYVKLAARWNPRKFDPEGRWLDLMQQAA